MYFQNVIDEKTLFRRWFKEPMERLRAIERGDGGTMGLMVALPLYERYLKITKERDNSNRERYAIMAADLQLASKKDAKDFWESFRHGFCHTGMPLNQNERGDPLPAIAMSLDYTWRPVFETRNGKRVICIDPWKFIDHVMLKYEHDPSLLTSHRDAPLMGIYITHQDTGATDGQHPKKGTAVSGSKA